MNMFKKTIAKTVKEYLTAIPKDRQDMMLFLDNFIRKSVPKLKVYFAANMIGYGSFPYINYKKKTINWPIITLQIKSNMSTHTPVL